MTSGSDLIGVKVTLVLILAVLAVLFSYFFVGVWLGTVLLLGLVVLAVVFVVRVVQRNELN